MFNKEKNEKYNGFLLVNKEKGYTSFDVCNKIKHKFNFKKVGHNGTLDPNATGLMVIGINKATKYLFKINNDNKEYIATILFGLSSDSEDICGKIINIKKNININTIDIDDAINKIKNQTTQIPPVYSAIKINGKRSCDLIRKKNIYTDLKPREIKIYNIKRISKIYTSENNTQQNYLCVDIKMLVSKGFYVRSFVRDLGNILNIPCLLKDLCRTKNGNYNIEESKKIDQVTISDIIDLETFLKNIT